MAACRYGNSLLVFNFKYELSLLWYQVEHSKRNSKQSYTILSMSIPMIAKYSYDQLRNFSVLFDWVITLLPEAFFSIIFVIWKSATRSTDWSAKQRFVPIKKAVRVAKFAKTKIKEILWDQGIGWLAFDKSHQL